MPSLSVGFLCRADLSNSLVKQPKPLVALWVSPAALVGTTRLGDTDSKESRASESQARSGDPNSGDPETD